MEQTSLQVAGGLSFGFLTAPAPPRPSPRQHGVLATIQTEPAATVSDTVQLHVPSHPARYKVLVFDRSTLWGQERLAQDDRRSCPPSNGKYT